MPLTHCVARIDVFDILRLPERLRLSDVAGEPLVCVCLRILVEGQIRWFPVSADDCHSARKEIRYIIDIRCMFVTRRNRYEVWAVDGLALFENHSSEVDRAGNVELVLSAMVCIYTQTSNHAPREDKSSDIDVNANTSTSRTWMNGRGHMDYRLVLGTIQWSRLSNGGLTDMLD